MAQEFLDFLMSGTAPEQSANYQYDPILQNRYTNVPESAYTPEVKPQPIMPRNVPAFTKSTIGESGILQNFFSPKAPTATESSLGQPVRSEPTIAPPQAPTTDLTLKQTEKSKVPFGSPSSIIDQAYTQAKSRVKDFDTALADYKKSMGLLPTRKAMDYESIEKPVKDSITSYKGELGKQAELANKQADLIPEIEDRAINAIDKTYKDYDLNIKAAKDELDKITADMLNVTPTDPNRFWKETSTGQKIAMGISLIFAAMTPQTIAGATKAIEGAIERDIDAQKQDAYRKMVGQKQKQEGVRTTLDLYRDKLKNDVASIEAARASQYAKIIQMMNLKKEGLNNKAAIMNADAAIADFTMKMEDAKTKAFNSVREDQEKIASVGLNAAKAGIEAFEPIAKLLVEKAKLKQQEVEERNKENLLRVKEGAGTAATPYQDKYAAYIDQVYKNDPAMKKEAFKQLGILNEQIKIKDMIEEYFNNYETTSTLKGYIPFTEAATAKKTAQIKLFPAIKGIMGERFTDADRAALVDPSLPQSGDTIDQLKYKKNNLIDALNAKVGDTYLVDSLGIRSIMEKNRIKPIKRINK